MEKLGIQLPVLLTQIVNFGILLFVLNKFLYKPILAALKKRREEIEEGLEMRRLSEKELETTEKKRQDVLKQARSEAQEILTRAKKDAKDAKEEIMKEGKQELKTLKDRQEKELTQKYERQREELQEATVAIAGKMVEKLLGTVLSEKDQQKVLESQLKKMKSTYGNS